MKCLPASKLHEANGNGIHDWHAEVLAMRTFNRLLIDECKALQTGNPASILQTCDSHGRRPFTIKDDVKLHMYCSEAPCMPSPTNPKQIERLTTQQVEMLAWS